MTSQGVLTYDCTTGTMNGDKYFVRGKVIMHAALPRSKLNTLMDNCSIHHIDQVKQELESAGILVIFLPPYSPDYNPCEEMFSYVKYYLKNHDEILQCIDKPRILKSVFASVIESQRNNWITHSG